MLAEDPLSPPDPETKLYHTVSTPPPIYIVDDKIDYRNLKYKSPTDHLQCPICQQPFIDPLTTICGHTFCKECIHECFKMAKDGSASRCPLDRTPLDASNPNELFPTPLIITNLIDDLKVYCLNHELGCEWSGSRWELEHHLVVDCDNSGVPCNGTRDDGKCQQIVERRHVSEGCCHRLFTCQFCKHQVCKITENEHLSNECLFNYQTCDLCLNDCIPKKNLDKHRDNCSHVGHLICQGRELGCKWVGGNETLKEIHEDGCALAQLSPNYCRLEEKVEGLVLENQLLQRQINKILDLIIQGKVTNLGYAETLETVEATSDAQLLCVNFELDRLKYQVNEKILPVINKQRPGEQELMMQKMMNENFVMREELNVQRMMVNSLRKQLQFMMFRGPRVMVPSPVERYGAMGYDETGEIWDSPLRSSLEERIGLKL